MPASNNDRALSAPRPLLKYADGFPSVTNRRRVIGDFFADDLRTPNGRPDVGTNLAVLFRFPRRTTDTRRRRCFSLETNKKRGGFL